MFTQHYILSNSLNFRVFSGFFEKNVIRGGRSRKNLDMEDDFYDPSGSINLGLHYGGNFEGHFFVGHPVTSACSLYVMAVFRP